MKFAMVFPGQGSQSVGMMRGYGDSSVIRATFTEASEALQQDLWALVDAGAESDLAATVNTQPLMLTAGVAVYRLWLELGGSPPSIVAGHSLGEYSALVVSGALGFTDALRLVRLRAAAMQTAVPVGTGAMAAVLGLELAQINAACTEAQAGGGVVSAANLNAPGQIVIAGSTEAVARAIEACRVLGAKRAIQLPVSAPFHCELMRPAAEKLAEALAQIKVQPLQIPLVNNVDVALGTDATVVPDALVRQAYSPVRWIEIIQRLAAEGVTEVLECGPSKVLAGMTRRIEKNLQSHALSDLEALHNTRLALGLN